MNMVQDVVQKLDFGRVLLESITDYRAISVNKC